MTSEPLEYGGKTPLSKSGDTSPHSKTFRDSGILWFGEIPAHWATRRLAWLFRERDDRGEPELPLLEVSISAGVARREFSTDKIETTAADFDTYKVARTRDIVFNKMRMWQGAVGVAPQDGLVSPDYVVAAPSGGLSSEYAGYLFRTGSFSAECARHSHGIVWDRLRLYWEGFRDIVVPLPSPVEQRSIADYLDKETARLDALVAAKERLLGLLAEKRRALITHAVTRGLDPRAPFRDSGIPWLGKIPAHWNPLHLRRILASMDYGISDAVEPVGNVAVLRMGDLQDGELDLSRVGYVDELDPRLLLRAGDLVFNRTNSLDQIGKVAIFRGTTEGPVSFASYLVRLRCGPDANPEYVNSLLNSSYSLAWSRAKALPAIGQANLNPNRYSRLSIPLPPLSEQHSIVAHIAAETAKLDALRSATERTIALLKERRAALIAAVVTGRMRIPDSADTQD